MNPYLTPEPYEADVDYTPACIGQDPELWFPSEETPALARRLCGGCPVALECLEKSQQEPERYGIFGGLTSAERAALRAPAKPVQPRLTHCRNGGHEMTGDNVRVRTVAGYETRNCIACANERARLSVGNARARRVAARDSAA